MFGGMLVGWLHGCNATGVGWKYGNPREHLRFLCVVHEGGTRYENPCMAEVKEKKESEYRSYVAFRIGSPDPISFVLGSSDNQCQYQQLGQDVHMKLVMLPRLFC
jgi:hypothetical protein